jgi:hypothetical protein
MSNEIKLCLSLAFMLPNHEITKLETSLNTYNELLQDNITKTYKHGSEDFIHEIDSELKEISSRLGIGDRIERMKKREEFISLKDHEENFENNPKCRLINPNKDTQQVISWFGNIKE